MKSKPNEIKLTKKSIYFSIIIIIVLVVLLSIYASNVKTQEERVTSQEIQEYKAALFRSISCQYDCPLTETELNNETKLLPDVNCIKICVENLINTGFNASKYNYTDLLGDDLAENISTTIEGCKLENQNLTTGELNYNTFFNCTRFGLNDIKNTYDYL